MVAAASADRNVETLVIRMTTTEPANAIAGCSRTASSRHRGRAPGSAATTPAAIRPTAWSRPRLEPSRQTRLMIIKTPNPVTGDRAEDVNCQSGGRGRDRSRLLAYTASSSVGAGRAPRNAAGSSRAARSHAPWASRNAGSGSRAFSTLPRFAHPKA